MVDTDEQIACVPIQRLTLSATDNTRRRPDWAIVYQSLSELGFVAVPVSPPATSDIILAAQLRLRFWRRQLGTGRPQSSAGIFGSDIHAFNAETANESSFVGLNQRLERVRERINTIKSARNCLLHWAQSTPQNTFSS